jgi:Cu/Ag efflux pump CusA
LIAFNSIRLALLILVSVPVVLVGGVFALPLMD